MKPGVPFFTTNAFTFLVSAFLAQMITTSAKVALPALPPPQFTKQGFHSGTAGSCQVSSQPRRVQEVYGITFMQ